MSHAGRRVALLCIDPAEDEGVLSLNYSTRKLVAALQSPPSIDGLDVHLVESRSKDADEFFERLAEIDPDVVGASSYVWSMPTFMKVARRWKAHRPDSLIVFGGPSARPRMLAHDPFADAPRHVDAFVEGEGEEVLRDIVSAGREGLHGVPGIMVSDGDRWRATPPRVNRCDLSDFHSPYVNRLLGPHQTGLLETFRGCPFHCTFCQWGDAKKLDRTFSAEYIAADLEALASLEAKGAALIDAGLNLNPRAFQNLVAAEHQVGFFKERNFYCEVYPSQLNDDHIAFLDGIRADRISVGLQSFDPQVLEAIQRHFDEENFRRVVETLAGIVNLVTVEIIMGLPGDNPRSFLDTLDRLADLPCEARVFHCLVLPDALMDRAGPDADMVYDPSTLQMISCRGWPPGEIAKMREILDERAVGAGGVAMKDWWEFPAPHVPAAAQRAEEGVPETSPSREDESPSSLPDAVRAAITAEVHRATHGAWDLATGESADGQISLHLTTPEGPLVLDVSPADPDRRSYRSANGIAYSYRRSNGNGPSRDALRHLDSVVEHLGNVMPSVMPRDTDRSANRRAPRSA